MTITGIKFDLALKLCPPRKGDNVGYSVQRACSAQKGPGVYVLIRDDKEIIYIGSYHTGVVKRWCRGKRKDIIHFMESRIRRQLKRHRFRVFAQDEQNIKRQIGHPNNKWINCDGIECRLITIHNPKWNKRGSQR